jgi:hypothetical protein
MTGLALSATREAVEAAMLPLLEVGEMGASLSCMAAGETDEVGFRENIAEEDTWFTKKRRAIILFVMEEKIFLSLEGNWSFKREISGQGESLGKASFTKISSDTLLYREDALFKSLSGATFKNFQEYHYRLQDGKICIYFTDGRLLHPLELEGGKAKAHHLCGCDVYDAEYHFDLPERFTLCYKVQGPKKGFVIATQMSRPLGQSGSSE